MWEEAWAERCWEKSASKMCLKKIHVCYTLLLKLLCIRVCGFYRDLGLTGEPWTFEITYSSKKKKVLKLLLHGTLSETNTSHLKMVVSNIGISFSHKSIFRCELLVSGRINHGVCCRWTQLSYGRHCDSVILWVSKLERPQKKHFGTWSRESNPWRIHGTNGILTYIYLKFGVHVTCR